jgi:hypothetical protein
MRLGCFCKTFRDDFDFFRLALASFRENLKEPAQFTVVLDRDCQELAHNEPLLDGVQVFFIDPWPDKYAHAMAMKACADLFTECDLILLFDSDMMLTKQVELSDLMVDGKPAIYFGEWNDLNPERVVARQVWGPASVRSLGLELDRDYMVAPLWLFHASTFRNARQMVEKKAHKPFLYAVYSDHVYDWRKFLDHPMSFCDIENLGMAAYTYEYLFYRWIKIDGIRPQLPVKQHWSHAYPKGQ